MSRGFGATYGVGASDYVQTGLLNSGSDKRSYFIWIYRNGNGGGNLGQVFGKNTIGGPGASEIFYYSSADSCYKYDRANASNVQTSRTLSNLSGTAGLSGVWIALLLTHDQSSGALTAPVVWYNGTPNSTSQNIAGFASTSNNTDPYVIGNQAGLNRVWDGFLAHFTIWDNILFGRREAQALTAGVHPMLIAPANCVCYLPLDGIHSPELDFTFRNPPGIVSGTKFGVRQPPNAPMYFGSDNRPREPVILQAAAAAGVPTLEQQYGVSVIT